MGILLLPRPTEPPFSILQNRGPATLSSYFRLEFERLSERFPESAPGPPGILEATWCSLSDVYVCKIGQAGMVRFRRHCVLAIHSYCPPSDHLRHRVRFTLAEVNSPINLARATTAPCIPMKWQLTLCWVIVQKNSFIPFGLQPTSDG